MKKTVTHKNRVGSIEVQLNVTYSSATSTWITSTKTQRISDTLTASFMKKAVYTADVTASTLAKEVKIAEKKIKEAIDAFLEEKQPSPMQLKLEKMGFTK